MAINPVLELLEKKAEQVEGAQPRGRNCLAIYLSHRENVEESLKAGWNFKTIWKVMREEGLFPASYDTFVRCARHVKTMKPVASSSPRSTLESNPVAVSTPRHNGTESSGFVYSPDADTDKLI